MTTKHYRTLCAVVLVAFAVLTVFMAWHARNFKIDASADTLLVKDNEHYIQSQIADQRYNPEEFILIAFKPDSGEIFSESTLDLITTISQDILTIDRVDKVNSLANVPIFLAADSLSSNIDPASLSWEAQRFSSDQMAYYLNGHPLYQGLLFNEARDALSMQVTFKENDTLSQLTRDITDIRQHLLTRELNEQEQSKLTALKEEKDAIDKKLNATRTQEIEKIQSILSRYDGEGEFHMGGNNLLAYQLISIIKSDLAIFGGVIVIIITLLLSFLFRHWLWVTLPLLCCGVSVTLTLGFLALLGLKVTVISANVIALQIILTLAVIIHLIVHYQEKSQKNRIEHIDCVLHTIKEKAKPCFYAGLTTTIGFGSLIFSGVQPVISFGWMMVVAMSISIAVSLMLFPAMLIVMANKILPAQAHDYLRKVLAYAADLAERRGKTLLLGSALVLAVGIVGSLRLSAENSFLNYFRDSTDVYQQLSYIDKEFGGSTPFDILYSIPEQEQDKNLVLTTEAIASIRKIHDVLENHSAVGNVTSVADFTRIAQEVREKPLTEYELSALYHALDPELKQRIFGGYYNHDARQARISARVIDTTANLDRAEMLANLKQQLKDAGVQEDEVVMTNLFVMYQDILARLVSSQVYTLALVYLAMAAVLFMVFSSLKIALIALAPNIVTTATVMGTMGLFGIPLDLMTITIAAVAMGISVDDTIHYVHRYLLENKHTDQAIAATNGSVGFALMYTTTVIVIGFIALVFSDFIPSVIFGWLTGLAMLIALISDMTLLPVLLKRFISKTA